MYKLILVFLISLNAITVNGQETIKSKNKKVEFHVDGICEMCKKRIEKAAFGTKGVKMADWNIESGILNLIINEQKTTVLTIQKAIAAVGHDNDGQKTTDEIYEKLHGCCQYQRK